MEEYYNCIVRLENLYPLIDKVDNNGTPFRAVVIHNELQVILHKGHGAGWSTWEKSTRMLMHHLLVFFHIDDEFREIVFKLIEDIEYIDEDMIYDEEDIKSIKIVRLLLNNNTITATNFLECSVHEIALGSRFRINEYDGSEVIEFYDENKWLIA